MSEEEKDRPVLGSKTETTYSTTRHSSTIGFDVGKELDAEIKQDPAYRSEPLLRLDQRDQKQNTNLAEPVRATLKCGQCGHRFLYKKDELWCDQCGGEAFSDAALGASLTRSSGIIGPGFALSLASGGIG